MFLFFLSQKVVKTREMLNMLNVFKWPPPPKKMLKTGEMLNMFNVGP